MCHELSVYIEVVFSSRDTQCWDVDGHVKYTEEGQREHCGDSVGKGGPIDRGKI